MKRFGRRPNGHKSSRMVLYEVSVRSGKKALKGQTVKLRPPDKLPVENTGSSEESPRNPAGGITRRPATKRRSRIKIATFAKKKEFFTATNLTIAALLLVAFMILIGRSDKAIDQQETGEIALPEVVKPIMPLTGIEIAADEVKVEEIVAEPAPVKGNVIVVASNTIADQLGPVNEYFLAKGIETEIQMTAGRYVLVSKVRFSGKSDPEYGKLKTRIEQIGKDYKPPQGFKSFGFDSIYLLNVSKIHP